MLAEIEGLAARVVEPSSGRGQAVHRWCDDALRVPPTLATDPATQSVDKGKVPSGQGRDKP